MAASEPDLARLVGLRTVKGGHYAEFRGTTARLSRVMTALEGISKALVQTASGPEALVIAVVETVRDHLGAEWVLFALADGHLGQTGPRHLIASGDGQIMAFEGASVAQPPADLPDPVLNRLNDVLRGEDEMLRGPLVGDHHIHVPVELDGSIVGGLSAWTPDDTVVDPADLMVLRILAGQATVAMVYASLFAEANRRAEELAERNAELLRTQRELSAVQRTALLNGERSRIARELHDEIGQSLTVVLLSLRRLMQIAPEEMREELEVAHTAARTSLANVRDVAQRLRPGVLEDLGLTSALASLIREFSAASGIPVESRLAKIESGSRTVDLVIYRVAQESLTNIARHSGARTAEVTLSQDSQGIVLSVRDDGIGVQGPVGAGVRGMMERALLVDAELTLAARPQGGTEVVLSIPAAREEAGA